MLLDKQRMLNRYKQLQQQLVGIGFICNGTLMSTHRKCGKPNCGCSENEQMRHGPYHIWTRKQKGKTITRSLSEKQATKCSQYIGNLRKMEGIIEEMKSISIRLVEEKDNAGSS